MTRAESTARWCAPSALPTLDVTWTFRVGGDTTSWDWALGDPNPESLTPVRRPTSGAASRHIPVRAFSTTTNDYVELESGLEHDLVRQLDRDRSVTWLVGQPFTIAWLIDGQEKRATHTPDLLSVDARGQVTVWDVKRPEAAARDDFAAIMAATREACHTVGWTYRLFTGLTPVHRHNLIWLHAYRRRPAWAAAYEKDLLQAARAGCSLGDVVRAASSEALAVIWHLIWSGDLRVDFEERWSMSTRVTA